MTAQLEVWIANPADVCRVDNKGWQLTIFDSTLKVLEWRGHKYDKEAATGGHWGPGQLPPGYYILAAQRADGKHTSPALVQVSIDGLAAVNLFTLAGGRQGGVRMPPMSTDRSDRQKSDETR